MPGPAKQWQSTGALKRDRLHPQGVRPGPLVGQPASCTKPKRPNPQSQSLSQSYGSNLPTSLTYIILSTRGYSPRRPAADMGTSWCESAITSPGFSRSHRALVDATRAVALLARTKTHSPCERIPGPRRLMQKRQLFPELRWASPGHFALPRQAREGLNGSATRFWNKDQIPFRRQLGQFINKQSYT